MCTNENYYLISSESVFSLLVVIICERSDDMMTVMTHTLVTYIANKLVYMVIVTVGGPGAVVCATRECLNDLNTRTTILKKVKKT